MGLFCLKRPSRAAGLPWRNTCPVLLPSSVKDRSVQLPRSQHLDYSGVFSSHTHIPTTGNPCWLFFQNIHPTYPPLTVDHPCQPLPGHTIFAAALEDGTGPQLDLPPKSSLVPHPCKNKANKLPEEMQDLIRRPSITTQTSFPSALPRALWTPGPWPPCGFPSHSRTRPTRGPGSLLSPPCRRFFPDRPCLAPSLSQPI